MGSREGSRTCPELSPHPPRSWISKVQRTPIGLQLGEAAEPWGSVLCNPHFRRLSTPGWELGSRVGLPTYGLQGPRTNHGELSHHLWFHLGHGPSAQEPRCDAIATAFLNTQLHISQAPGIPGLPGVTSERPSEWAEWGQQQGPALLASAHGL